VAGTAGRVGAVDSVLVTGAYGLLGGWVVKALLAGGARVVVLKRGAGRASALALEGTEARCTVVDGDLADLEGLAHAVAAHRCDTVVHLASQAVVAAADHSPVPTYEANVRGTWNVLEACRRHDVTRVAVASSQRVYGPDGPLPHHEDDPLAARAPYDVSKACADLIARSAFHAHGLPVAVARFANLYGGGDANVSRLVPGLVASAAEGRAPVIRSDGSPAFDFLYVEDAAAAVLSLLEAPAAGAAGEAFNVGGPAVVTVREVVTTLLELAGSALDPQYADAQPGPPARQWVDSAKLTARTGWTPRVELRDGLARTLDWYRAHPEALA
jgi:CDP-glucose 4,6-dehydratase